MANRYWVGGTATWDATAGTKWALTTGGAGGQAVPTAADDVFFDGASGAVTVTVSTATALSVNCTGFTGTLTGSGAMSVAGNLTLVAGMTCTYTGTITFTSTTTGKTITAGGKTLGSMTFNGVGGGWQFQDTINIGSNTLTLTNGALDFNSKTVTMGAFSSNNSNVRTLTLGSATVNCSIQWNLAATNLTFTQSGSTIASTVTSNGNFAWGGLTYGTISLVGTFTGSNVFNDAVTCTTFTAQISGGFDTGNNSLTLSGNLTVTGTCTLAGTSTARRLTVRSSLQGTARTITAATNAHSYLDLSDITGAGAASWNLASITGNSGDRGRNSGITFTTAATQYWFSNTGNWYDSTKWFLATGGTGGAGRVPLPQDNVVFDANSFSSASQTVTDNMNATCANLTCTGVTNSPTLAFSSYLSTTGNVVLASGLTVSGGIRSIVAAKTFTRASATMSAHLFVFSGGTLTLQDSVITTGLMSVEAGTIDFNSIDHTFAGFADQTVGQPHTWTFGTSTVSLTGTASIFSMGASTFSCANGTIKFTNTTNTNLTMGSSAGLTIGTLWFDRGASTGAITVSASNTIGTLKDTGTAAHTIKFTAGTTQTLTNWQISGTAGNVITIDSTTTGTHTLTKTSGVASADYLNIQHSVATSGRFYAGVNSVNNQAVATAGSGWIFSAQPIPHKYVTERPEFASFRTTLW